MREQSVGQMTDDELADEFECCTDDALARFPGYGAGQALDRAREILGEVRHREYAAAR